MVFELLLFLPANGGRKIDEETKMKKKVLLLSTVGIAAGVAYALENRRRKQTKTSRESLSASESQSNRTAPAISSANANDSAERTASMARIEDGKSIAKEAEAHQLDDQGTSQAEASQILKEIRDNAFDASNEKLALALGRPTEEIEEWTNGDGLIDGDVVMKARALAIQRGMEIA
jgi:hypothetical protein